MATENISQLIQVGARRFGPKAALCLHGSSPEESYTYDELNEASGRLAAGFVRRGIEPGDRVAVLSESRPRWGAAFFATIRAGAVVVPLDPRQSAANLGANLADARPKFLVVSGALEKTVAGLLDTLDYELEVVSLETKSSESMFASIDTIAATESLDCIERRASDAAVITYTSGTMGTSKGVVTTHGNLLFQIRALQKVMRNDSRCMTLSILPLSHLFELTAGFLVVLYGGGCVYYCNSLLPTEIVAAMRERQVSGMVTVPLFLKLFAQGIRKEIAKRSLLKRSFANTLLRISPSLPMALRRRLFGKLHRRFGGRLKYFVSGGAPLDISTLHFFESIGLPVYQGYGLAEASPVIATNGPVANRSGSVGKALPGIEVRTAEDGEILTRGPHVMRGYFQNDELTARVIDADGWLHTGDLGRLDDDGFLHVSGRKKNVIVLGSGQKVQPEKVEALLFEHPDIQEGCVVGMISTRGLLKDTEEVCAVAVASEEAVRRSAGRAEILDVIIQRAVQKQAQRLDLAERPTRIVLRNEPLPRTTTRKICRPAVQQWLSEEEARL